MRVGSLESQHRDAREAKMLADQKAQKLRDIQTTISDLQVSVWNYIPYDPCFRRIASCSTQPPPVSAPSRVRVRASAVCSLLSCRLEAHSMSLPLSLFRFVPSTRISNRVRKGAVTIDALKGEPLARETASTTRMPNLSWPHERFCSSLIFATVAHRRSNSFVAERDYEKVAVVL